MKLSLIIVNYNVRDYLAQCLDSVREAFAHIDGDADVWVVDNNSSDDSVAMLRQHYPWVNVIAEEQNLGFSRANNVGIRQSEGEYVLLLNPDTLVAGDTLQRCVEYLNTNSKVGALGVRMFDAHGHFALESRRGLPTPFTAFCKMAGLTKLFPRSRTLGRYFMQYLDEMQPHEIEVISGAFMMIRRAVLDEVGLLDERFFMYGEDIDLSYRITLAGWQNHYVPYPILHYKGESTQKTSFRYVHVFYNAMLIFYDKHFGDKSFMLTLIVKVAVVMRAALDYLQRKFWGLVGKIVPSRPRVQRQHIVDTQQMLRLIADGDSMHALMAQLRRDKTSLYVEPSSQSGESEVS